MVSLFELAISAATWIQSFAHTGPAGTASRLQEPSFVEGGEGKRGGDGAQSQGNANPAVASPESHSAGDVEKQPHVAALSNREMAFLSAGTEY